MRIYLVLSSLSKNTDNIMKIQQKIKNQKKKGHG